MLTPWKESYDQSRQNIKKQRCYFVNKGPSSQGYGFSSSHVWMWELDCEESWAPKMMLLNCGWIRLLRVPWTARRSNQSILKEICPGCSLEGLMLKLKLQYFGHLMWRAHSFEKTLMLRTLKAGGEGDNRDERVRWHHWLDGREFQWTPGVGDGQGRLACCASLDHKELDMTEWLNWTELNWIVLNYISFYSLVKLYEK